MTNEKTTMRLRAVLRAGATVFGLSALFLLIAPSVFVALLGLADSTGIDWSMRMIGITLLALTGNMFSVASRGTNESVRFSGRVMQVSAFALGVLTLLIPVNLAWFTILYALVGFGFSAAYTWAFLARR